MKTIFIKREKKKKTLKFNFSPVSLVHSQISHSLHAFSFGGKKQHFRFIVGVVERGKKKKKKGKSKKIESLDKSSSIVARGKERKKEKLNPFREMPFRPTFSRPRKSKS